MDKATRLEAKTEAAWERADRWKARAEAAEAEVARLRAALEQIANRDPAEMATARTLHYDMAGWARAALDGGKD
jgi:hypothetical protein